MDLRAISFQSELENLLLTQLAHAHMNEVIYYRLLTVVIAVIALVSAGKSRIIEVESMVILSRKRGNIWYQQ